jgi:type IV secretory pathway TrbL component
MMLCAAAVSAALGWWGWQLYQQGASRVAAGGLVALSAALSAFLLYNLSAGGPARRTAEGAGAAADAAAAAAQ